MFTKTDFNFTKNEIFSYNLTKKRLYHISAIVALLLIILLSVYYIFFLKNSDVFFVTFINTALSHIVSQIKELSILGIFYTSLFGGLFFIVMPIEVVFITFLRSGHNAFLLIFLYIIGLTISYTINYYIGMKLAYISKKIISLEKFYKIKVIVNRYGSVAIFVINALPLPSQALAAILGVFKYNKTKFYLFFLLGQMVKYIVIVGVFLYFKT